MNTPSKFIVLFIFLISVSAPAHAFVVIGTDQTVNTQAQQTPQEKEFTEKTPEHIAQLQQHAIIARKGIDFSRVFTYSSMCFFASFYIQNQSTKQFLRRLAIVEPIARLIATRNFYGKLCTWLPFFGKHMHCTNEACPSICNRCKLKLIYKEIPLRLGLMLFLNRIAGRNTFI